MWIFAGIADKEGNYTENLKTLCKDLFDFKEFSLQLNKNMLDYLQTTHLNW